MGPDDWRWVAGVDVRVAGRLKAAMLRDDHPEDRVALCLPDSSTYRSLAEWVSMTLHAARLEMI